MPFQFTESDDESFTLSASHPRDLATGDYILLNQTTTVQVFTAAQYNGVQFWALNQANAQAFLNGQAFQGYLLTPTNQYGLNNVTLPAGQWWVAASYTGTLSGSQTISGFDEVSVISFPGESFIGNVPMAVSGAAGAWSAQGFTITGAPSIWIETEGSGGEFMIMTPAQFQSFEAAFPHGFTGGTFSFVYALGGQAGGPALEIEGQLQLPAGTYELVWINTSGGWAGGAADLSGFAGGGGGISTAALPPPVSPPPPPAISTVPTAGADSLAAGAGNTDVEGGSGNDTIAGWSGGDYLRGGDGDDSIVGGSGFDDINGNKGNDTISGGLGGDWLVGGQGNDSVVSTAGNAILYGNLGNDSLSGGPGNELIRGGQGDDTMAGGAGNDWISGDRGSDTMSGGTGADTFHSFSGAGTDIVTDFSAAQGDKVQLDAGTTYSLRQSGADTVVDMGGGDQLVLKNVTLASLPQGWIFIL